MKLFASNTPPTTPIQAELEAATTYYVLWFSFLTLFITSST